MRMVYVCVLSMEIISCFVSLQDWWFLFFVNVRRLSCSFVFLVVKFGLLLPTQFYCILIFLLFFVCFRLVSHCKTWNSHFIEIKRSNRKRTLAKVFKQIVFYKKTQKQQNSTNLPFKIDCWLRFPLIVVVHKMMNTH